jgi:hypothetical protein
MFEPRDLFVDPTVLPALVIPAASTELVVFDTTRVKDPRLADQGLAAYVVRQNASFLKRAWFSVFADQPLTFFHRHLALMATGVDGNWDNVPDGADSITGTVLPANELAVINAHFFGDDHRLVLKTGGTPPTFWRLSLRFSPDQSVAE